MKKLFKLLICFAIAGIGFTGCTNDENGNTAAFNVKLVDAPGDYENVLVDVQAIEVILDGETHELPVEAPGIYDLLELTGGLSALLLETELPSGKLSQLRLILGGNNSVISNGDTLALKTPSAQQSGLKLNIHQELEAGLQYNFILDFNVDKSIVAAGNHFILKPVIRATLEAESGAIGGVVTPAEVQSLVTATDGTTEIAAYTAGETGAFLLYAVPAGIYNVVVTPDSTSGFSPVTVENVVVEKGQVNQLETIALE